MVRQAAWIRSLLATYIRPNSGRRMLIGGLFGAASDRSDQNLDWHGAQQAAFIIRLGTLLRDRIKTTRQVWADSIREHDQSMQGTGLDPAFYGRHSLLNTDQGVRGFLHVTNDISVLNLEAFKLREWNTRKFGSPEDTDAISEAVESLSSYGESHRLEEMMADLATFDWRTSSAEGLDETERTVKRAFRGSGGYREIRRRLLIHLADARSSVSGPATKALDQLGFEHD